MESVQRFTFSNRPSAVNGPASNPSACKRVTKRGGPSGSTVVSVADSEESDVLFTAEHFCEAQRPPLQLTSRPLCPPIRSPPLNLLLEGGAPSPPGGRRLVKSIEPGLVEGSRLERGLYSHP